MFINTTSLTNSISTDIFRTKTASDTAPSAQKSIESSTVCTDGYSSEAPSSVNSSEIKLKDLAECTAKAESKISLPDTKTADKTAKSAAFSILPPLYGSASAAAIEAPQTPADSSRAELLAASIVKTGGSATEEDAKLLMNLVAKVPLPVLEAVAEQGTSVVACRDNVTDYLTHLKGQRPPGWPPGLTWEAVQGVYYDETDEVVIASVGHDTQEGAHIPVTSSKHSSCNLVYHELAHAFDIGSKYSGKENSEFNKAREGDFEALTAYEKTEYPQGNCETFAETFAMFLTAPDKLQTDRPNLYAYFSNLSAG